LFRRILAVGLIATAIALYWLGRGVERPKGTGASLLPDCTGTIGLVVCNVNSARRAALRNVELVNRIINALPPRIRVVLALNDPTAFTVASNPWPERIEFLRLPAEISMTIWPQDPFVVLQDGPGRNQLLLSRTFERAADREMAIELAGYLGWKYKDSQLVFEGGNIVADEEFAFIGGNTIRHNAITLEQTEVEMVREFERELGRRVLVVGPVPQPIGHVDMMLTPLGGRGLLLADPDWGARLAEEELLHRPEVVEAFERKCERFFFGHPSIRYLLDRDGQTVTPPEVVGMTRKAIEDSRTIAPGLDRLAAELSSYGYEVARVPFLFTRSEIRQENSRQATGQSNEPSASEPEPYRPTYPEITYNNVLLETFSGRRIVYMPQYGWPALDEAGRKVWADLGYEVHPVEGFSISAMYGGSMRCCVKVLKRTMAQPRMSDR